MPIREVEGDRCIMVTEVSKADVSATALKEIQLSQVAMDAEAKRIEERKAAREIETEPAARTDQPETERDYGNYNDYAVNSDHEMVITVRERVTGKEIKQIPSEEALAVRQAYRKVTEHIIDETV